MRQMDSVNFAPIDRENRSQGRVVDCGWRLREMALSATPPKTDHAALVEALTCLCDVSSRKHIPSTPTCWKTGGTVRGSKQ
jgi:hypothetical protein